MKLKHSISFSVHTRGTSIHLETWTEQWDLRYSSFCFEILTAKIHQKMVSHWAWSNSLSDTGVYKRFLSRVTMIAALPQRCGPCSSWIWHFAVLSSHHSTNQRRIRTANGDLYQSVSERSRSLAGHGPEPVARTHHGIRGTLFNLSALTINNPHLHHS